jgi:hypothetical protein
MDVKEIGVKIPPLAFGPKGRKEGPDGADFQKALQKAHSHLDGSAASSAAAEDAGGIDLLEPLAFPLVPSILGEGASSPRSQGLQATERTLDLLEQYREALSNPGVSLKKMGPLVQALRHEVQEMGQWTDRLAPSDPLRKIMNEVGILTNVEMEKFNRGDYV